MHTVGGVLVGVLIAAIPMIPGGPELGDADPTTAESHCVVTVVGESEGGELITDAPECFGSFAAAMEFASSGHVSLPSDVSGADVFVDGSAAQLAASSFTLGIHYDGYNGTGSSISVVGSSCSGGWWNASGWWNNRISSSYNGCSVLRYYEGPGLYTYLGRTLGAGTTDNLPSGANNKAGTVSYSSS